MYSHGIVQSRDYRDGRHNAPGTSTDTASTMTFSQTNPTAHTYYCTYTSNTKQHAQLLISIGHKKLSAKYKLAFSVLVALLAI